LRYGEGVASGTVIARRTRVGGNVHAEGDLVVEGRVEGAIHAAGKVTIAPSGVALAEIRAREAEIAGVVVGNVFGGEGIAVLTGARIVGDLAAPQVAIAAGATIEGRVERTLPDEPAPAPTSSRRATTVPLVIPVEEPVVETTRVPMRARAPIARPAPPAPARRRASTVRPRPPSQGGVPGAPEPPSLPRIPLRARLKPR
jgi:cytoskeletal protein CcmA (bactofilin family)